MQEEIENRTLTLIVNSTKFSGRLLQSAVTKYMANVLITLLTNILSLFSQTAH